MPQALKTWRTCSRTDISLGMFLLSSAGVALRLVYGIALQALPIILANGTTRALALTILADRHQPNQGVQT